MLSFAAYFDSPTLQVVETRHGPMLCFRNDTGVSEYLRTFGAYGEVETELYSSLLSDGECFVDVGAHIGSISAVLRRTRPDLRIIAFEPQAAFFALASINLSQSLDQVPGAGGVVYPFAVGRQAGIVQVPEIDIRAKGNYGSISLSLESPRTLPTPQVGLGAFLASRAPAPRLVKIDVEGMETDVIEGLSEVIHDRLILSIEADRPAVVQHWLPKLLDQGFDCYLVILSNVSRSNPAYRPGHPLAKVRSPQILAFKTRSGGGFHEIYANYRLAAYADYVERAGARLG